MTQTHYLKQLKSEGYQSYWEAFDVTGFPRELRQVFATTVAPSLLNRLNKSGYDLLVQRQPYSFLLLGADGERIVISFTDEPEHEAPRPSSATVALAKQLVHLLAFADWARAIEPHLAEFERNSPKQ